MRVLGIAGPAGSGKDTIAEWFGNNRGGFITSFAYPIKAALTRMFPGLLGAEHFLDRDLKETTIPEIGRSPRELAQLLGTEFGRRAHPDLWIRALERTLSAWGVGDGALVVIPDVRFENEAAWVRERGRLIHVERDGRDGSVGLNGHASEAGVIAEAEDYYFFNGGTIDDLHRDLDAAFPV